ncbi:mitochondrial membrane protein [Chytriomyces hyalinus]|nr:mitochondrial membrane protein [Chytriomyces hyalinus]KAJ3252854.1 mitochondrial membrane protein [Chytriomyces hyalinus]
MSKPDEVLDDDEAVPFLLDLQTTSTAQEREILKSEHSRQLVMDGIALPQTSFDLAYSFVRSPHKRDQEQSLPILLALLSEHPSRSRDCLFYLALANFKLKRYAESRKFNNQLLRLEPQNAQSRQLRSVIEFQVRKDGLAGMAIVGTLVGSCVGLACVIAVARYVQVEGRERAVLAAWMVGERLMKRFGWKG